MKIVLAYPPNIDAIAAVLPEARNGHAIFCYGDTIFNPGGGRITPELQAHEQVHSERQMEMGPAALGSDLWWEKYLTDVEFRFDEELLAHQAEYGAFRKTNRGTGRRIAFLDTLARRLSGPLYGRAVTFAEAKNAIRIPFLVAEAVAEAHP